MRLVKSEDIIINGEIDRLKLAYENNSLGGIGIKEVIPMELAYWFVYILVLYFIILSVVKIVNMIFFRKEEEEDKFTKVFWGVVKPIVLIIAPIVLVTAIIVVAGIINIPDKEGQYYGNYILQGEVKGIEEYTDGLGVSKHLEKVDIDGKKYTLSKSKLEGIAEGDTIIIKTNTRIYNNKSTREMLGKENIEYLLYVNGYTIDLVKR